MAGRCDGRGFALIRQLANGAVLLSYRCVEQEHSGSNQNSQAGYDAAGRLSQRSRHHEAAASPEAGGSVRRLFTERTNPHCH